MAPFRRLRQAIGLRRGRPSKHVRIGRKTYGVTEFTVFNATAENPVTIGAYCSIAQGVLIVAGGEHSINSVSSFPELSPSLLSKGAVHIGNDVWVGSRALILSGVTIGDGAIIGAGAVVTRHVEPYTIVGGNPARFIRRRFPVEIAEELMQLAWWAWPEEKIAREKAAFGLPVEEFIERYRCRRPA